MVKNILSILFLLLGVISNAQIVNIPDPDFKAFLIVQGIDANSDGEIQESEALQVPMLNITGTGIDSLEGLDAFAGMVNLTVQNTGVTQIDLTNLAYLTYLDIYSNPALLTIDISDMAALMYPSINANPVLMSVDASNSSAISHFWVFNNVSLTSVNVMGCVGITNLNIDANNLANLDLSGLSNVTNLFSQYNPLNSINLSGCTSLQTIELHGNTTEFLDVSGLPALTRITMMFGNPAAPPRTITAVGCPALSIVEVQYSNLVSLDVSGSASLENITAHMNPLTNLNVSGCTGLITCDITNTLLTTADFSDCTSLTGIDASGSSLETLYIKNGSNEQVFLANTPLQFICADGIQIGSIIEHLQMAAMPNVVVSSYCTFTPGGQYNTISGNVTFDLNGDGCNSFDVPAQMFNIMVDDGTTSELTGAMSNGGYTIFTGTGNYTLTAVPENSSYFNVSPANTVTFSDTGNNEVVNFCLSPNGVHNDVEVAIFSNMPPRPGFDLDLVVTYKNKGNQTINGTVSFSYDDAIMDMLTTSQAPDQQLPGYLAFNYSSLLPFETRTIVITANVNGPMETPPVNIDDILVFNASISPVSADETPLDNDFSYKPTVVGSFDPNDITCLQGSSVSDSTIGDYLHYVINFENTGTAAATNVVVKNQIDSAMFDLSSIQVISTSHSSQTRVAGNTVEFIHENIMLGESEKGHVVYKIKSLPTLSSGATVSNSAEIFFDYNFPVATNVASTTFTTLSNQEFNGLKFSLVPNPAQDSFIVECTFDVLAVEIFDIQGRIVCKANSSNVNVADLNRGVYLVKVVTENGSATQKLVKQ